MYVSKRSYILSQGTLNEIYYGPTSNIESIKLLPLWSGYMGKAQAFAKTENCWPILLLPLKKMTTADSIIVVVVPICSPENYFNLVW